jgi:hypothetical protein
MLDTVYIDKRCKSYSVLTGLHFNDSNKIAFYSEFKRAASLEVRYDEKSNTINNIQYYGRNGKRKIELDADGKLIRDTFDAHDAKTLIEIAKPIDYGKFPPKDQPLTKNITSRFTLPTQKNKKLPQLIYAMDKFLNPTLKGELQPILNYVATRFSKIDRVCTDIKFDNDRVTLITVRAHYIDKQGIFLVFDNSKNLIKYVEGSMQMDYDTMEYDMSIPDLIKNGESIQVTFHRNGYPATYHSIIRNRLFGRQIEWNDKGEVVSDVDLDIPQEWKDAPQKIDPNKSKQ